MPAGSEHIQKKQHNPIQLPCSFVGCRRWFRNKAGLTCHLRSMHPSEPSPPSQHKSGDVFNPSALPRMPAMPPLADGGSDTSAVLSLNSASGHEGNDFNMGMAQYDLFSVLGSSSPPSADLNRSPSPPLTDADEDSSTGMSRFDVKAIIGLMNPRQRPVS